jgi:acyl-lipid omega-6 desaturase (Delta-12 desaturase)
MRSHCKTRSWKAVVAKYQKQSIARGLWQLTNTLIPYISLWSLMYFCVDFSLWLLPPLVLLAGGFLVRIFIIFHDCGHGSFFKSSSANHLLGSLLGILTFTPYFHWRWEHAIHHSTSGNLDLRGIGDIWILTVTEYLEASRWKRFTYRFVRNPIVFFGLAPLFLFLFKQRFSNHQAPRRERRSVYWANIGLLGMILWLSSIFGFLQYAILQSLVLWIAGSVGIWMFYLQHQFEGVYWERSKQWDYEHAALKGSSFYKLPRILQWFSGNIGFHHVHHLSPRIPNYYLEKCHRNEPLFQGVPEITLLASFKAMRYRLYDEQNQRFVSFSSLRFAE